MRRSPPPLVLASRSASRAAMLEAAGAVFEAVAAELDERAVEARLGDAPPVAIARALALAKATAVSKERPGAIVLGSDSLVVVAGRRFDKPECFEQAREHLRFFSGKTMRLVSAAALVGDGRELFAHAEEAVLRVRDLSDGFIARYLEAEWPAVAGCVGVFRMEGRGVQLFEAIEGDHFTVLGMPLLPVLGALRRLAVLEP